MTSPINLEPVRKHLSDQIGSVNRLLNYLDEQEQAIRDQDVQEVMAATTRLQGEVIRRARLEEEREVLLGGIAIKLGCLPEQVTARRLAELDPDGLGNEVRLLSEQLSDLVQRLQLRHEHVRALMQSELAFVSHLLQALSPQDKPAEAYGRDGQQPGVPRRSGLDLQG